VDAALGPINTRYGHPTQAATQARQSAAEIFSGLADRPRTGGLLALVVSGRVVADLANAGRDSQFPDLPGDQAGMLGRLAVWAQQGTALRKKRRGLCDPRQEDCALPQAQDWTQLNQAASVAEALGLARDYQGDAFRTCRTAGA